jgi:MFS family permease
MGYSSANAQLLTIPVYFVAMLVCLIFAFLSDKYQRRVPFIIGGYIIAVLGFIAQLAIPQPRLPGLTYGMLFLVAIGLYAPFTSIVTLTGNNLAPSSKRAVGMALLISVGNMGGIPGSLAYFEADKPQYPTGFGLSLAV